MGINEILPLCFRAHLIAAPFANMFDLTFISSIISLVWKVVSLIKIIAIPHPNSKLLVWLKYWTPLTQDLKTSNITAITGYI